MKTILTNAFSISMLEPARQSVGFQPISLERARMFVAQGETWESAVGHADTARLFSSLLGVEVPVNRTNVQLVRSETRLVVGQYIGPRLPEGATALPEGARIDWWLVVRDE